MIDPGGGRPRFGAGKVERALEQCDGPVARLWRFYVCRDLGNVESRWTLEFSLCCARSHRTISSISHHHDLRHVDVHRTRGQLVALSQAETIRREKKAKEPVRERDVQGRQNRCVSGACCSKRRIDIQHRPAHPHQLVLEDPVESAAGQERAAWIPVGYRSPRAGTKTKKRGGQQAGRWPAL